MERARGDVTVLLERLSSGDRSAEEELMPRVYLELHRIASARLRAERSSHTLQATALVNEAYIRLCGAENIVWQNRLHFFKMAARLMRRILVDHARKKNAVKNNHGIPPVPLDDVIAVSDDGSIMALEIDRLLEKLAEIAPRQAQVVELKFFAGLTEEEIAASMGVDQRSVRRDWFMARAWLFNQLNVE